MSIIKETNTWAIWMYVVAWAAFSIYAEQKWKWGGKVTGVLIAILGSLVFVNFNVLPIKSDVYGTVFSYIMPLAIPLLLFKSDLRKIYRESGRTFGAFHIACAGSLVGAIIAGLIFISKKGVGGLVAMETGAGTGGSVNLIAMAQTFGVDSDIMNASLIYGNVIVSLFLVTLIFACSSKFLRKHFSHPHIDEVEKNVESSENAKTLAQEYWKRKDISLLDIAKSLAISFIIVAISKNFSAFIGTTNLPTLPKQILGNVYLSITFITVTVVTLFPKFFDDINGAQEIGTFMIMMFFVALGTGSKLMDVIALAPYILVFKAIMMIVNMIFTLGFGKLLKFDLEELMVCCLASYGGPTTAVAVSINRGWTKLLAPGMLVGLYGYIIGNYIGIFAGNLF